MSSGNDDLPNFDLLSVSDESVQQAIPTGVSSLDSGINIPLWNTNNCDDNDRSSDRHYQTYRKEIYSAQSSGILSWNKREDLNSCSCHRSCNRVFLTYANQSTQHVQEVLQFGNVLKNRGFRVASDLYDRVLQDLFDVNPVSQEEINTFLRNKNDWLDFQFQNATYIIVCLSPLYFKYTKPDQEDRGENVFPAQNQLHTKYIYNHIQTEMLNSLCRNYRIVPIIFPNSNATQEHLPVILRSTIVYEYPVHELAILRLLNSRQF